MIQARMTEVSLLVARWPLLARSVMAGNNQPPVVDGSRIPVRLFCQVPISAAVAAVIGSRRRSRCFLKLW